jgi:hypothetical protein
VAAFFTAFTAAAPRDEPEDFFLPEDLRRGDLRADEREAVLRLTFLAALLRLLPPPRFADFLAEPDRPPDFAALARRAPLLFRPPDFLDVAMTNSVIGWFAEAK